MSNLNHILVRSTPALFATALVVGLASAQVPELVSISASGTPANGHSGVGELGAPPFGPAWKGVSSSSDGRFVAFYSEALDVVPGVVHPAQIYVRDRLAGTTELATVPIAGFESVFGILPELSARGRYLAFASRSPGFVLGDTNNVYDVFVRDLVLQTTECVSVDANGNPGNSDSGFFSSNPWKNPPTRPIGLSISADGRFVAFSSSATNLTPGDSNLRPDVFVRDRLLQTTRRISVEIDASDPPNAFRGSLEPRISADGRRVAFTSTVSSLVPGDTNQRADVFVTDLVEGWTVIASRSSSGAQSGSGSYAPRLSGDGRFVAFMSASSTFGPTSSSGPHVFVRDLRTGTTSIECIAPGASSAAGISELFDLSADGRFVLFLHVGSELVPGGTNSMLHVFRRDREHGTIERVTVGPGGVQADGDTWLGRFLGATSSAVIASSATNLVAADTNGRRDVFVVH